MTKDAITYNDIAVIRNGESSPMSFDLFRNADWRCKLDERVDGDKTVVTFSSGKTIAVETRFLRFLRVLAAELASKEPTKH
ncbi:MAG: hypothetical protein CMI63_18430 [Parvularcula sp.]|nr:hypothetical protein [Parvularcula sp.]